jgi:hypothetical protein
MTVGPFTFPPSDGELATVMSGFWENRATEGRSGADCAAARESMLPPTARQQAVAAQTAA